MVKSLISGIAFASFVLAGSAMAADLPVHKTTPSAWSWTGLYIGVHAGAGLYLKEQTFTNATLVDDNNYVGTGFLGGGQVGFNYQAGSWVWGAEAQFSWSDLNGKDNCIAGSPVALINCRTKVDWLGTAAARFGFVVDKALIFVKGGVAWAHDNYDFTFFAAPFRSTHVDDTRWGWMFGTGVEYAVYGNWSAKVEYDYLDFGTGTVNVPDLAAVLAQAANSGVETTQRIHLVKLGVNYRFGPGALVAKY